MYRGDRGHSSAVGGRRSKTNQSSDQSVEQLVEIGIGCGNANWSLKYESVVELQNGREITKEPFNCEDVV